MMLGLTDKKTSAFRIAVIGSGPIGKLLASSIHLPARVELIQYEADKLPPRPSFGYGIGPPVLRACKAINAELARALEKLCDTRDITTRFWDSSHADKLLADVEMPTGTIHAWVGRQELLKIFDDHTPDSSLTIRYGKTLEDVVKQQDGRLELSFQDGHRVIADAILGCDGLYSTCRILAQGKSFRAPVHSGLIAFRGKVPAQAVVDGVGESFATKTHVFVGTKAYCIEPEWIKNDRECKLTKGDILSCYSGASKHAQAMLDLLTGLAPGGCHPLQLIHLDTPDTFTNSTLHITNFGDAAHAISPHLIGSLSAGFIGVSIFVQEWNQRVNCLGAAATNDDLLSLFTESSESYQTKHGPISQKIWDWSAQQGSLLSSGVTDIDCLTQNFSLLLSTWDLR